jgi:hypothetical protein
LFAFFHLLIHSIQFFKNKASSITARCRHPPDESIHARKRRCGTISIPGSTRKQSSPIRCGCNPPHALQKDNNFRNRTTGTPEANTDTCSSGVYPANRENRASVRSCIHLLYPNTKIGAATPAQLHFYCIYKRLKANKAELTQVFACLRVPK